MGRLGRTRWLGPYSADDREAAAEAIHLVGLEALRKRPFADLSGGQRQRVLIARALVSRPRLLLLDEPTSSLDIGAEESFHGLLARLTPTMTVVLVSHDIGFVEEGITKVVCVRGTVQVHATKTLTPEILRELYGHDVRRIDHSSHNHTEQTRTRSL
jgi:zinc transport system ATP-binding protein